MKNSYPIIANCPLCNFEESLVIYDCLQLQSASIVKCKQCLHVYTIYTGKKNHEELYEDNVYTVVENRNSIFDKILTWEYGRIMKQVSILKKKKGTLLDFGSGKGKFASIAKENGWQVNCVETAIKRAEYAKQIYQLEVNTSSYSTGKIFNEEFDVLTLLHVVEHLPQPKILLKNLLRYNLKEDGLLIIEVPNINSWQARIAGKNWLHWDIPRHINHFNFDSLEQFTTSIGFVSLKTSYFSFHLGVLGMTDSILKRLGYKKNIIYALKTNNNNLLKICVSLLLPVALALESIASMRKRGGIIRSYYTRQKT